MRLKRYRLNECAVLLSLNICSSNLHPFKKMNDFRVIYFPPLLQKAAPRMRFSVYLAFCGRQDWTDWFTLCC